MKFPAAIAQMKATGKINVATLYTFEFASGIARMWSGIGDLVGIDAHTYAGCGDLVSVEGGGQQTGFVAPSMTLTLAGDSDLITDTLTQRIINSESEVYGRWFRMALQFFGEDWQPLDAPLYIYAGVMDRMEYTRDGVAGTRAIKLIVESPFVRRRTPRVMMWTDKDQKRRDPTDRLLEFLSGLQNATVTWPKY